MSQESIDYTLNTVFGTNKRLLVFYDFSRITLSGHVGIDNRGGGLNYGVIENCDPAVDTGVYSGVAVGLGTSVAAAKAFTTGTFIQGGKADLGKSNLEITGTNNLPYSTNSVMFDFEFNENVSDCVLFGSLEKTSTTLNDQVVTGAKGYNVGITKRGKLFYQGFSSKGDFIHTSSSIDLSKRNVIGFSVGNSNVSISRFDYLNNNIQTELFNVDTNYIAKNEKFFLGGSNQYYRGDSGQFQTSNISLNSFCLLSGYIPASALFSVGSGLVGDYFSDAGTNTFKKELTGYNQIPVYKTGITGYDYENTGSLVIQTGRYMQTGNFFSQTSVNTGEGDRFFTYRSFDDALSASGLKSFVKEEVGYLHPNSGYQYLPTGERSAFDTLGLQNVEGAVSEYVEQRGISGAGTVSVKLFGSRFLTGTLSGISGVIQQPAYQTVIDQPAIPTSGVRMNVAANDFKKNYFYFLGERITGIS